MQIEHVVCPNFADHTNKDEICSMFFLANKFGFVRDW
jgi:hypothetical protein